MELEAANAALQESHSRALAELEAEKRAMQEAHQQEREALEAQNLAIQESYRLKLMEAESVHRGTGSAPQ